MDALNKLRGIDEYMHAEKTGVKMHAAANGDLDAGKKSKPDSGTKVSFQEEQFRKTISLPVHYAVMPNGKHIPLLKTALTTACERNCTYCAFRTDRDFRRQTFQPDELAKIFMQLHQAGIVKGLFLSSGVAGGGCRTQDRLLDAAEILRKRHSFNGYLHLKIMPGAEQAQVERAMRLADRVSVNLEAPTVNRLSILAPQKQFLNELLTPLKWIEEIRREHPAQAGWKGRWPSSTTQFVVGAIDETDLELLQITSYLHQSLKLSRVYFSGFNPVRGTPLENRPGVNPTREVRLYQAAFLLRDYQFDFEELPFSRNGNLSLEVDPKLAWAQSHLKEQPVEINTADFHELIRVPGIGPVTAKRIIDQRRNGKISSLGVVRKLGASAQRAAPYLLINGHYSPEQLSLL